VIVDPAPTWPALQAELRRVVPPTQYDIWLAGLQPGPPAEDRVVVLCAEELRSWVGERFLGALRHAAAIALGRDAVPVELRTLGAAPPRSATTTAAPSGQPAAAPAPAPRRERLNPRFTFDQFVVGESNRMAHAAALAVAELPAQAYNPLFLYGPPGVGKTHLLHAIGNYVRLYGGGLTVRHTTVEAFTNEFVAAIRHGGMEAFKDHYRHTDVLLVDDVQFLTDKRKTEEELFHTVNALADAGAQLVLTCDRLPADLTSVADRLRERFAAGLVCDIGRPDRATRLTVLRKRAHHDGIVPAEPGVLELLADEVQGNIRALEGALIRVVAYASLRDEELTLAVARRVLDDLYGAKPAPGGSRAAGAGIPAAAPVVTVELVQDLTCEHFGLTREELLSASRTQRVTWPRQVAMFLAREHTDESLPGIGRRFGGRDHTTVLHACRRTAERLAVDEDAHEAVRVLTARLTGAAPAVDDDRTG
jgi:chromosomal replication initiator protein